MSKSTASIPTSKPGWKNSPPKNPIHNTPTTASIVVVGSVLDADTLLKLVGIAPILKASSNVEITKRSGKTEYIFANELDGKNGEIELDGKYQEFLTGAILSEKVKVKPYQVLILHKV